MKNILFLDTETTGLTDDSEVLTIGMVSCEIDINDIGLIEQWNILNQANLWFKPKKPIDPSSSEVHGITIEDYTEDSYPDFDEFINNQIYLGKHVSEYDIIVGHNFINFDNKFLKITHDNILDTYILSKKINKSLPFHRLSYIYYYYKLHTYFEIKLQLHNSLSDCLIDQEYLKLLANGFKLTENDLLSHSRKIDSINNDGILYEITFGKHFGTPYMELPIDYLQWLAGSKYQNKSKISNEQIKKTAKYVLKHKMIQNQ